MCRLCANFTRNKIVNEPSSIVRGQQIVAFEDFNVKRCLRFLDYGDYKGINDRIFIRAIFLNTV